MRRVVSLGPLLQGVSREVFLTNSHLKIIVFVGGNTGENMRSGIAAEHGQRRLGLHRNHDCLLFLASSRSTKGRANLGGLGGCSIPSLCRHESGLPAAPWAAKEAASSHRNLRCVSVAYTTEQGLGHAPGERARQVDIERDGARAPTTASLRPGMHWEILGKFQGPTREPRDPLSSK